MTAGLIGAAVAPTDPAVMFSVLGDREIEGRTDTILEGESGANDPVGIALMLGLIELATHADETFWVVVRVFALQMGVGLARRHRRRLRRGAPAAAPRPLGRLDLARLRGLPSSASRRSRTARASSRSSSRG